MAKLIEAIDVEELDDGECVGVELLGNEVALIRTGGRFYAIEDRCTHRDAPLSSGMVEGCTIICPLHGAEFDLESGEPLSGPATKGVKTYPVKIEGGKVYVEVE